MLFKKNFPSFITLPTSVNYCLYLQLMTTKYHYRSKNLAGIFFLLKIYKGYQLKNVIPVFLKVTFLQLFLDIA